MVLTKIPGPLIVDDAITSAKITDTTITNAKMAVDPSNASNLSSGDVPLAQLGNVPDPDLTAQKGDIALLGFKIAANGSLVKYNLVDQTVDAFEDASGVNTGASTNALRDASNYYSGSSVADATGGTITYSGGKTIHTFTASGNWVTPSSNTGIDWLVVGGGGGSSGSGYGGGGGAGGYRTATGANVTAQTYSIVVGTGGAQGDVGNSGTLSSALGFASAGGGGGVSQAPGTGQDGGSGGGGYGYQTSAPGGISSPVTSPVQGYLGGKGGVWNGAGGGGGGSASIGIEGHDGRSGGTGTGDGDGGPGGAGTSNSISGSAVYYAAGGGGGWGWVDNTGGGHPAGQGDDGAAGTGWASGGYGMGGGSGSAQNSGVGTDGVVILSYTTDTFGGQGLDMTLVSATTAAQAAPTKGDIVLTYTNGLGTTTLDTDLTAEISADGGSTWTALALASEGSTGSHNIATSHDVTISSTITAPYNMAYRIKTLNQDVASKTTRIQAVSLGWS